MRRVRPVDLWDARADLSPLLLTVTAVVLTGLLWLAGSGLREPGAAVGRGLVLVAVGTAAAHLLAVPVPWRRPLHAVGLHSAVLAAGLLLTSPAAVLLGVALGTLVATALTRDVPPWRTAGDTAVAALGAATGLALCQVLRGGGTVPTTGTAWSGAWAVLVSVLVAAGVRDALSLALSTLTDGQETAGRHRPAAVLAAAAALAAPTLRSGIAVAGVLLGRVAGSAALPLLLLGPAAAAALLLLAAARGGRARADLELLSGTDAVADADPARALLASAVEGLGGSRGELLLDGRPAGKRKGGRTLSMLHLRDDRLQAPPVPDVLARQALPALRAPLLLPTLPGTDLSAFAPELARFLLARGYLDLVSAPVQVAGHVVGALAVSGRARGARRFDAADLRLLEALAAQLGRVLTNRLLREQLAASRQDARRLEELVGRDELTGLLRRAAFEAQVEVALAQREAEGSVAVLYIDVDGFKQLNDQLGHAVGDAFLRTSGERLTALLRGGDLAARLGGDEFAVLVRGLDGQDRATLVAARVVDALSMPVTHGASTVRLTSSVGVAVARAGQDAGALLDAADRAMYVAKRSPGAHWSVAEVEEPPRAEVHDRVTVLVQGLQAPVLPGSLEVHYQRRIHPADGRVVGVEALARWRHPDLGLVLPHEFVPLADRLGRMVGLGHDVLTTALHQVRAWDEDERAAGLAVNVNLTDAELRDGGLTDAVAAALRAAGLPGTRLVLEVGGAALQQPDPVLRRAMGQLADLGVRFALDDFGASSVPLQRLGELPLHSVKIPASVLGDAASSARSANLPDALVALARSLGLLVAVEGVERADQAARLVDLSCDEAQGYHYGRPVPAGDGDGLLR